MTSDERGSTVIYDADTGTYRATHDFTNKSDISTTLCVALEAVAEAEGIQLQPLYAAVDPDGLARLFQPTGRTPRQDGKVVFAVDDLDVTVSGTGEIVITPPDPRVARGQ